MSDCETEISGGGSVSVGAARVALVCQLIASRFPRLDEISVLDLASDEGAFSRELAQQGAEVVSIEGREASHQRAREIRDDENLDRWTTYCADVIEVDLAEHGPYDVVLCLGFLYHLRAGDAVRLLRRIAAVCSGITIVETQISTESVTAEFIGERSYHGRPYREDPVHDGDALAAYDSFWFTGRSLLDAFADAGFGLVTEVQSPRPHLLNRYRDHGWWAVSYTHLTLPTIYSV